jgi:hypothetical protein
VDYGISRVHCLATKFRSIISFVTAALRCWNS